VNEEKTAPEHPAPASEIGSPPQEAKPVDAIPNQPATERELAEVKNDLSGFERSTLLWTRATFGILAVTCAFICLQWCEMRSGSQDTHDLAVAAKAQADRAKDLVDQMKLQAGATHDLATAAGKQADASRSLSYLTAKQYASSQQSIESQRASLNVGFKQVLNPITFHDGSASIVFSILIENPGSIKATHGNVRFKSYYSGWGSNIFTEPLEKQRDYCAVEAPASKDWTWRDGKRINLKGLRDWTFTVEPHGTYEYAVNFGMSKPTATEIIKWPPADAIQRNPELVVTNRVFPIVVGCIDYQSGAMPEKHQTGFIFEVQEAFADAGVPNAAPTFSHYGVDLPRDRVIVTQFFFGQGKKY
jgi:hypothetical protein